MGLIKPIDVANVKDREYDVLTALAVNGEYIEEIGEACVNPAGYTQGSIFLARNDVVMHLYKATANITAGQAMTIGTNCELSSLDAMFKKSGQDLDSVKQALTNGLANEVDVRARLGAHNLYDINANQTLANMALSSNSWVNTNTDTKANLTFNIWYFDSSNALIGNMGVEVIYAAAKKKYSITIPSGTKYIQFGHSGSARNLTVKFETSLVGAYVFEINFTGVDVQTGGGFVMTDIMIVDPKDAYAGYTPYAKTNRELTEEHKWKSVAVTGCELTQAGLVTANVSSIVGAKEVVFFGAYIPNIAIPNVNGINAEMGWIYSPVDANYKASGVISVNFTNGNVTLQVGEFPVIGNVKINAAYYR